MVIVFFFSRVNFLQPPLSPSPSIHSFIFWLKDPTPSLLSFFLVLEAINSSFFSSLGREPIFIFTNTPFPFLKKPSAHSFLLLTETTPSSMSPQACGYSTVTTIICIAFSLVSDSLPFLHALFGPILVEVIVITSICFSSSPVFFLAGFIVVPPSSPEPSPSFSLLPHC